MSTERQGMDEDAMTSNDEIQPEDEGAAPHPSAPVSISDRRERAEATPHDSLLPADRTSGYRARWEGCLLYTSPSPRDRQKSRMPSSA